ncbi:MAG: hypothetical protein DLM50_07305 [Candidatus Meridianibacter frigidus]|nr:MAG: hypothetical protein DLM50_07305 [Candidatus Eremiobacteraeota bacterium]
MGAIRNRSLGPTILVALVLAGLLIQAAPAPAETAAEHALALVRRQFRMHRPPPPYETYTLIRVQNTELGYPDYVESYKYHIWIRNLDRAALGRKVFRGDYRGPLEFLRPAFNEPWDPGPPSADVFEPAPAHPHTIAFVPTPEPSGTAPPLIATVRAVGEFEYRVTNMRTERDLIHLSLAPIRDPDRNRLRELYADKKTYELKKIVATDKLFVPGFDPYPVIFTYTIGMLNNVPVVTDLHGVVDPSYHGDGEQVDYHFRDITFPSTLPDWYFEARQYARHQNDAPL